MATVAAVALVFGALHLFHRVKINFLPTRVWIRENGIEMGELLGEREWNGFAEIVGFFFDSDSIEGKSYRSLYWLPEGAQYPDSAVVPPQVDEGRLRTFLASKGLEELELDEA